MIIWNWPDLGDDHLQETRSEFVPGMCQSYFMDLLWLLHGFVKVVICISRPLTNETKLKFDQDFKACRRFCFELKVLIEWVKIFKALGPLCLWQCLNISAWPETKSSSSCYSSLPSWRGILGQPQVCLVAGWEVPQGNSSSTSFTSSTF